MDIIVLYALLAVWLIDVIFTFYCTVQVGQDLERMEKLYEEMRRWKREAEKRSTNNSGAGGKAGLHHPEQTHRKRPMA
jgi:hypothetical protein